MNNKYLVNTGILAGHACSGDSLEDREPHRSKPAVISLLSTCHTPLPSPRAGLSGWSDYLVFTK